MPVPLWLASCSPSLRMFSSPFKATWTILESMTVSRSQRGLIQPKFTKYLKREHQQHRLLRIWNLIIIRFGHLAWSELSEEGRGSRLDLLLLIQKEAAIPSSGHDPAPALPKVLSLRLSTSLPCTCLTVPTETKLPHTDSCPPRGATGNT